MAMQVMVDLWTCGGEQCNCHYCIMAGIVRARLSLRAVLKVRPYSEFILS